MALLQSRVGGEFWEGIFQDALPAYVLTFRNLDYRLSLCGPFCYVPSVVGPAPSSKAGFEALPSLDCVPGGNCNDGHGGTRATGTGHGLGLSPCAFALTRCVRTRPAELPPAAEGTA